MHESHLCRAVVPPRWSVHIGRPNGESRRPYGRADWRHRHDLLEVAPLAYGRDDRPNGVGSRLAVKGQIKFVWSWNCAHSFISHFSIINEVSSLWQVGPWKGGFANGGGGVAFLFKHSAEQILEEPTKITSCKSRTTMCIDWTKGEEPPLCRPSRPNLIAVSLFLVPTLHRPRRLLFCLRSREPTDSKFGCIVRLVLLLRAKRKAPLLRLRSFEEGIKRRLFAGKLAETYLWNHVGIGVEL